jgi:hypothetical protein
MDGPRNPHDILAVLGEKELQSYLVNEIQDSRPARASMCIAPCASHRPLVPP